MKFISLQKKLKTALQIVSHITTKNVNLPILNNILIKIKDGVINFISTNLEIGIIYKLRGKIEEDGEIMIDSKLISEYVSLLDSKKNVLIDEKDNKVIVKCENYKTSIKSEDGKDFPLIPTIIKDKQYICSLDDIKNGLNSVVFAVSNSENRVELSGVLFLFNEDNLTFVATDSYRLAEKKIKTQTNIKEEESIIVPVKTIQELLRILNNIDLDDDFFDSNVNIYISENQILFTIGSVELISRLINGKYPDYKQIIPTKNKTKVIINKVEFIRAVKASSLFSKISINDVNLYCGNNKVIISSFSGQSGESEIDLSANVDGIENEITVNYRFLLEGLNNINNDDVILELTDNNTPCLLKPINDNNYIYIIMPIKQ